MVKVRRGDRLDDVLFWRELALLIERGLPLHEAWECASAVLEGERAELARGIAARLQAGEPLGAVLEGAEGLGEVAVRRLAAELPVGVSLEDALRTAADELEAELLVRDELAARLVAPAAQVALGLIAGLALLWGMLRIRAVAGEPTIAGFGVLRPAGAPPGAIHVQPWQIAGLVLVLLLAGVLRLRRTWGGLHPWARLRRRRFALRVLLDLAALGEDGLSLPDALARIAERAGKDAPARDLARAAERIRGGETGAAPLLELGLFPPWVVWSITSMETPLSLSLYLRELAQELRISLREETRRAGDRLAQTVSLGVLFLLGGLIAWYYSLFFTLWSALAGGF